MQPVTSRRWATTSNPHTSTVPDVGTISVVKMLTAVVLPAPLCPRNPKISPRSIARSMLRSTGVVS